MTATRSGDTVFLVMAAAAVGIGFIVADHLGTPFDNLFDSIGKQYAVDPNLLRAIAKHESGFNPSAVSKPNKNGTKDYGLMQINDATARAFAIPVEQLLNPSVSIGAAAKLLASIRKELGDKLTPQTLIAAYNAGSPAIKSRGIFNTAYVADVMTHYQLYSMGRLFA